MEIKRHFAFAAEKHPELVHYLNMEHTPSKSAGFAAAAAIFHRETALSYEYRRHDDHFCRLSHHAAQFI